MRDDALLMMTPPARRGGNGRRGRFIVDLVRYDLQDAGPVLEQAIELALGEGASLAIGFNHQPRQERDLVEQLVIDNL